MQRGLVRPALTAAAVLGLAACGASDAGSDGVTLESWREAACEAATAKSAALEVEEGGAEVEPRSSDRERRQVEAMQELVSELEAIPLPDEDRDPKRFVELFAESADRYAKAMPRIEAATRRLDTVMKSIDADELPPPPKEPTTVAGDLMSQVMSIPEYAEAFEELMEAYSAALAPAADEESERLEKRLGLDQCMSEPDDAGSKRLSSDELRRCGSRGAPVSLQTLVDVFQEHDLSLEIQEPTCGKPEREQVAGFDADATNAGPEGLGAPDDRRRKEGHILCDVAASSFQAGVEVTKYETDSETHIDALNVSCTIYPDSTAREAAQVAQLKKAMEAVVEAAR